MMSIFQKRRANTVRGFRTIDLIESLEKRVMLSAAASPVVEKPHFFSHSIPSASGNATIRGFIPSQVRTLYGFDQVNFSNGTVAADGTGQTIAIVDAYFDPTIASDLAFFDRAFSLNAPPSFTILNQTGGTTPAPDDLFFNWAAETALDVEWVHAIAPNANIVLVEANSQSVADLTAATDTARHLPNVSVVSMSWGFGEGGTFSGVEFKNEVQLDSIFTTPAGHQGVTFVASSGDYGTSYTEWPGVSPNVVSVGGTSLYTGVAGTTYAGEASWQGSGGGPSAYESAPRFQSVAVPGAGVRVSPDVGYAADPATGFATYNTTPDPLDSNQRIPGWQEIGGTSAGSPQWASLIALANQGRALLGKPTLDGPSGTLPTLYSVYSGPTTAAYTTVYKNYFNDVIDSANSPFEQRADAGYDQVTGLGTPKVPAIIALLGGAADTGLGGGNNALAADLQESQVSGALLTNPPTAAFTGSSSSMKMRVTNNGRAYSGDVKVTVYASTQTSLDGSATVIGTTTLSKLNLRTGGNRKLKVRLTYPTGLADGKYFILATTNTVGTSTAPIISLAPQAISIAHPRVDLATYFAGGNSVIVHPGQISTADIIVQNIGNVKTTGLWSLSLFSSLNLLLDGSDTLLTQLSSKKISLAPGRSTRIRVRFLAPSALAAGTYNVIASTTSALSPADANSQNDVAAIGTV